MFLVKIYTTEYKEKGRKECVLEGTMKLKKYDMEQIIHAIKTLEPNKKGGYSLNGYVDIKNSLNLTHNCFPDIHPDHYYFYMHGSSFELECGDDIKDDIASDFYFLAKMNGEIGSSDHLRIEFL